MAILDDTREDWSARPPLRTRTSVPWADRIGVSWHWIGPGKGPSASGPHSACLKQVRDWQAQHQANGWKDIGYNALICQHGRAIEGRGLTYSGSHSPGVNTIHVGIQFMVGNDTPGGVSPVMVARAQKLRADVGRLGKNIRRDWGHRDDKEASTECPGNAIYKWVHSGGPTQVSAAPTPAPVQEDEVTPQDIKDITNAVLTAKVVPSLMLENEKAVDIPRALDLVLRWSLSSRNDSAIARSLAEAQATAGRPLTAEEVEAATAAGVKAALSEAAQIEVVVKGASS